MQRVILDATSFAKENEPHAQELVDKVLKKPPVSEIETPVDSASIFATNIWPSLKSRGWKALVVADGDRAGKTVYSYGGKEVNFTTELERHTKVSHICSNRVSFLPLVFIV